jgi:hypothetical protein
MDQYALYFLVILLALFALYAGLLYYDSKVLGMSFEKTIVLADKYCHMHWDCDKQKKELHPSTCKLLKQPHMFDFFKNRSLAVRFLLYFFSPSSFEIWIKKQNRSLTVRFLLNFFSSSSFELWIEKQKTFCLSKLYRISEIIERRLTNSFEEACDFWIYIQDLLKDKTHYRECKICYRKRLMIVAVCGHSTCLPCFERMDDCPICRMPIVHSQLITLEEAIKNGILVY